MVAANTALVTPGAGDFYTSTLNNGILGAPNADYAFAGGAGVNVACDTSKQGVFRIAGTAATTLTVALNNPVDGRIVTLYFVANSAATMGITLPTSVVYLGTPPNLTLPAGQTASIILRWDAIMNSGAGGWVELHRTGFAPTWIAPTLGANISNLGSGWETAGYRIDAQKMVHLKGVLTGTGIVNAATIFTLPVGYRPAAARLFTGMSLSGSTPGLAVLSIDTAGVVKVNVTSGTSAYSPMENAHFAAA